MSYEWSFGFKTDGRESRVPMVWNDAGMKTVLVKAIDSEEKIVAGLRDGLMCRTWSLRSKSTRSNGCCRGSKFHSVRKCLGYFIGHGFPNHMLGCRPGVDTDGIGSADDDCDVEGENLTWSWQNSGVYNVVFHATDDNGAGILPLLRTVLNLPPLVMVNTPNKAIAGEIVKLDASATRDSPIDKEYLTVVWDVDCSVDSDGDGIKDNDADLVGSIVEYKFPRAGKFEIKAIAWDEEILKPSSKSIVIDVNSPDMTAFEQVVESLTGESKSILSYLVFQLV